MNSLVIARARSALDAARSYISCSCLSLATMQRLNRPSSRPFFTRSDLNYASSSFNINNILGFLGVVPDHSWPNSGYSVEVRRPMANVVKYVALSRLVAT